MDNKCVSCGEIIPEGRQVCPQCEKRHSAIIKHQRQTLCWKCKRLDCSWMRNLIPVPGWTAEPSQIKNQNSNVRSLKSYFVKACPLFKGE